MEYSRVRRRLERLHQWLAISHSSWPPSVSEIQSLLDALVSFTHEACASSSCQISESLEFPLSRSAAAAFQVSAELHCQANSAWSWLHWIEQIQNAKSTQTKEQRKDSTQSAQERSRFRKRSEKTWATQDGFWYLQHQLKRLQSPSEVLSGGSDRMYDLAFDLHAQSTLVNLSKGIWNPLDPDDLTNPQLVVDPALNWTPLSAHYHHHERCSEIGWKSSRNRDGTNRRWCDAGTSWYTLQRIMRSKRISRQITGDEHGLVSGLEEGLISEHIIKPWLAEEFFNCLAFFLMTRKPKYWQDGNPITSSNWKLGYRLVNEPLKTEVNLWQK